MRRISQVRRFIIRANINSLSSVTLIVGADDQSTEYSGVLSGSAALQKIGVGALTLSGANTLTGDTKVSAATLLLGHANAGLTTPRSLGTREPLAAREFSSGIAQH